MTSPPSNASPHRQFDKPIWSVPVVVADIPESGTRVELIADETVRRAVTALAGIMELPRLEARFEVTKYGVGGLKISGQVQATVIQECVVTLEPMETAVSEPVELYFAPETETFSEQNIDDDSVALGASDPPEVLRDGRVDLGEIAVEFLLLGIDPYPRKEGAVFETPQSGEERPNPFAVLASLKKPNEGKDR